MNTLKNLSILGVSILFMLACNNDEKGTDNADLKKPIIEVDTEDIYSSDDYDFILPRPFALVTSFEKAGVEFEASRMNDPKNVENYNTDGIQLLNLGVYSSDLVYSIINDQPQSSINNFNAIKSLGDKIGMGRIFNEEELALRIEKNIANREVMEDLLIDLHEKSQEYLENNQMRVLAAIQFAGAWIEGMYLATFDVEKKDASKLSHYLVDHMSLLKNAIKGLEAYKDRGEKTDNILTEMKDLQSTYNELESIKNAKGFPQLTIEEIIVVSNKIHKIRKSIIS
ncbi:MAG TPA: hypothetical protein VKX29_06010 [Brumimicrobium sp.]|nr:hypothetical protein [Brumimicrobium sp.]